MPGAVKAIGTKVLPLDAVDAPVPPSRLLSNGHYTLLVTSAGTGFSKVDRHALTSWRGDRIEDPDGLILYVRDLVSRRFWPIGRRFSEDLEGVYEARSRPGRFEIKRVVDDIEALGEICVHPDLPAELRRVTLINHSSRPRVIELTSQAEVVLHDAAAHASHPAFSKLFVRTEGSLEHRTLLATRRPRARGESHPCMFHTLIEPGVINYETDRARFLGRCPRPGAPRALTSSAPLSKTTGNVLDPIMSLRRTLELEPGAEAHATFALGAADGPLGAHAVIVALAGGRDHIDLIFEQAELSARSELKRLGISIDEGDYFQSLAGALLYGHPGLRARRGGRQHGSAAELARYGVTPGRALAVLHAEHPAGAALLADTLKAHRYWKSMQLPIDVLVLKNSRASEPRAADDTMPPLELPAADLPERDLDLIDAVARLVIEEALPDLSVAPPSDERTAEPEEPTAHGRPCSAEWVTGQATGATDDSSLERHATTTAAEFLQSLEFWNGNGGFALEGREYVMRLSDPGSDTLRLPPRPWINVIANESFGCLVSETGAGTTWSRNSREHRLTPWSNDPVADPHGEAFYIRDEESGDFWSPFAGPAPRLAEGDDAPSHYEMRHGTGYSCSIHSTADLHEEVTVFIPRREPVKITRLRLTNRGSRPRCLSLFAYYRLVLGVEPDESSRSIVTEFDQESDAVLARNPLAGEFADSVAFAAMVEPEHVRSRHATADREAFIGRNGRVSAPAALERISPLDTRTGAGIDPCFAQQIILELAPGDTTEVSFLFGEAIGAEAARALIARYATPRVIEEALQNVREFWKRTLSAVTIATPSRALDVLVNTWLPYQTLACRLWGRTAFYQSGGAFGFRDQLQDAAALVYHAPELTRQQLLLHAAHQFVEGDVLHWWHPPRSRGIRTRFADDLLWLPYLTAFYIEATGDSSVLDETVPFLEARQLGPDEDEAFLSPGTSETSADLYVHCCRAIDRSLNEGRHHLPLFGTGDWNDGMNRVGREGKGESVWLGFFVDAVLGGFAPICERRDDKSRVERYQAYRASLRTALNDAGWDGAWYRRGYYDDGTPLGSRESDECRIDALAQAWAVLSGVAPRERAHQAMAAVEEHLISIDGGLIRLLTPPFDRTPHDPGYIKGYVPGVRENGGQYTHAALWVVRAMAELGRNDRVAALLDLLNPIHHARTPERVGIYQVEPYVVAADVYGAPPHVGRGGWTWYTGSSGWMLRVALESLLGFRIEGGDTVVLKPCIPDEWPEFTITYRPPGIESSYEIRVLNPRGAAQGIVSATIDGATALVENGTCKVKLAPDGGVHHIEVVLGSLPGTGAKEPIAGDVGQSGGGGAPVKPGDAR